MLRIRGVAPPERNKKAIELLRLAKLDGRESRAIFELSGGEAQRLAVAHALGAQPRILLLDEPLGSVDETLRFELAAEIRAIQRRYPWTVLYVTHDQAEGVSLADRMTVLRDGRIEQTGDPVELIDRPSSRFVAEFIGKHAVVAAEARDGRLDCALGSFPCDPAARGHVCAVVRTSQVTCGGPIRAKVLARTHQIGGWRLRVEAHGVALWMHSREDRRTGDEMDISIAGPLWIVPESP